MRPLLAWLFPPALGARPSTGLLALRLLAGGGLMSHGWGKIQNPLHWMDQASAPAPAVFQLLAAVAEFCGGLGLILGALTVIASFGVLCTMAVAINLHVSKGDGFGRWELASVYLVISIALIACGPGAWSVDTLLQRRREQSSGKRQVGYRVS